MEYVGSYLCIRFPFLYVISYGWVVARGENMVRVVRKLSYSNGSIVIANFSVCLGVDVYTNNKLVESKIYSLDICDNTLALENIISLYKGKYKLLHKVDDCTKVLSESYRRYTIRGSDCYIHVLYSDDCSSYIRQVFLPYNYYQLSVKNYMDMFRG